MIDFDDIQLETALLNAINAVTGSDMTALPADWTIDQTGFDSITLSEIIFHLEDNLGVEIEEERLLQMVEATTMAEFLGALSASPRVGEAV